MYITAAADSGRFVAALQRVINAEGVSPVRPKAAEGLQRGSGLVLSGVETSTAKTGGGFLCSTTRAYRTNVMQNCCATSLF